MEVIIYSAAILLIASLTLNWRLLRSLKTAKQHPKKRYSIEAEELLHDLTRNGTAVVKITPLDPSSLFIHKR